MAEVTKKQIYLSYGDKKGNTTFSFIKPDTSDENLFSVAKALNSLQALTAQRIYKVEETELETN